MVYFVRNIESIAVCFFNRLKSIFVLCLMPRIFWVYCISGLLYWYNGIVVSVATPDKKIAAWSLVRNDYSYHIDFEALRLSRGLFVEQNDLGHKNVRKLHECNLVHGDLVKRLIQRSSIWKSKIICSSFP